MLKVVVGSDDDKIFRKPFKNPLDIFSQIYEYFKTNKIQINLRSFAFNVPQSFGTSSKKIVMLDDLNYNLRHSFFNFAFRLLCAGTSPIAQFKDIMTAIDHPFIKVLNPVDQKKKQVLKEAWNAFPADY